MKALIGLMLIVFSSASFAEEVLGEVSNQSDPDIEGCGDYLYSRKKLVFAFPLTTELGYLNINGKQKGYKPLSSEYVEDNSSGKIKKTSLSFENGVKVKYEVSKWGVCDECDPIDDLKGTITITGSGGAQVISVTGYSGC